MIIGILKEIKAQECRVALVPDSVAKLTAAGHDVLVEHDAGAAIGFDDASYSAAGAVISDSLTIFAKARLLVKVKEPQVSECDHFQAEQILFTFLHLAADKAQALKLQEKQVTAIAYETVTDNSGALPILLPMSVIAGRLATQEGAFYLKKSHGGKGILLGAVPGAEAAQVLVIGAGSVGINAAEVAYGMGAKVIIADSNSRRLDAIEEEYPRQFVTMLSSTESLQQQLPRCDLIIGAVLVPGASAPKLLQVQDLKLMQAGTVLVDVAIDQGGCFASSRATSHEKPIFIEQGIVHYCVSNMPSAAAKTASIALSHASEDFVLQLADFDEQAIINNPHLLNGLQVYRGHICNFAVANALNLDYRDGKDLLLQAQASANRIST